MSVVDVYAERKTAQVIQDAWGHLAPVDGRTYRGVIVFTQGAWGDLIPIKAEFEGLPDSPWFFESLMEFVVREATGPGKVYRFTGTYRRWRSGKHRFAGKIVEVPTT